MDIADFSEILEKSRALRAKQQSIIPGHTDQIPRLERALPQIDRESRRIAAAHTPDSDFPLSVDRHYDDSKALRLLSEYGFQTDNIERNLQSVALLDVFEPYKSVADTNLDAYLGQMHENTIVTALDSALEHAKSVSMTAVTSTIDAEWEASKRELVSLSTAHYRISRRKILKTPATVASSAFASPFRFRKVSGEGRSSFASADVADSGLRRGASHVTSIYEAAVKKAVYTRASPALAVPVATEFDDALVAHHAPRGDVLTRPKNVQHLHAVFNALRYIVGEANVAVPPPEGAFGGMHAPEDRRKACFGAYRFLCLQFREDKMKREVQLRPVEARRGGVPGMKADVRAYLNLIFDRGVPEQFADGVFNDGMPIWPQIYYCLRAGSMQTALEIVQYAIRNGAVDSSLDLVERCMDAARNSSDERTLPHQLLEQLVQDYGLSAKRGSDPYKRVCYVVLARLDPAAGGKMSLLENDYALLFYSIEDYLWLRLSIVHLEGDEVAPDSLSTYQLSLRSIQEEVRSFGPSHFDPQGDTPAFYALVLILTCQFAEAIKYLDRKARILVEAAHIAYVLYYHGIIREPQEVADESGDQDECFQFDYSDLLWRYVAEHLRADPATAAVYLFTLRDGGVRNELLRRLLLETKEFGLLVGNTSHSMGSKRFGQIGVLQELWPLGGQDGSTGNGWLSIVEIAASEAEEIGDKASAVALYEVAGVRGKVVLILVDNLSAELIAKDSTRRMEVFKEALSYRRKLADTQHGLDDRRGDYLLESLLPSFDMLLSLGEFFDLLWAKKFDRAWLLLHGLSFLPTSDAQLVSKTSELSVGGGVWSDALCDRVPEIVLGAMECLAALYQEQRQTRQFAGGQGVLAPASLRAAGRTLFNFSGMLPNVSPDVSAHLVRLDVLTS